MSVENPEIRLGRKRKREKGEGRQEARSQTAEASLSSKLRWVGTQVGSRRARSKNGGAGKNEKKRFLLFEKIPQFDRESLQCFRSDNSFNSLLV